MLFRCRLVLQIGAEADDHLQLKRRLSDPEILKRLCRDSDGLRVTGIGPASKEIYTLFSFVVSCPVKDVLEGNLEETDHILLLLLRHVMGGSLDHADFRFVVYLLA